MQSDLRRHREFHNAVLAYHCDVEGCNFSARAMQTVKRHQKVDHQVGNTFFKLITGIDSSSFKEGKHNCNGVLIPDTRLDFYKIIWFYELG